LTIPAPSPERPVYTVQLPKPKPVVTITLVVITVVIYVVYLFSGSSFQGSSLNDLLQKSNIAITNGQWWRLLTPVFVHYSPLHLALNMYALYVFGPGLEKFYGHSRFLALYLLAGFVGVAASFIMGPYDSGGASGAVFGLVAANGIFVYQNREFYGGRARSIISNTLIILALNLVMGFTLRFVDNWGHLGGLLGGGVYAWLAGPLLMVSGSPPVFHITDKRPSKRWIEVLIILAVFFLAAVFIRVFFG
jgi:rhomboid protease GluP